MASITNLDDSIEDAEAAIEGYVVTSDAEQVPNWLSEWLEPDAAALAAAWLGAKCSRVAILKSLAVAEDHQGTGLGAQLLDGFINRADADVILVICDDHQTQREGFDLGEFYGRRDFHVVAGTNGGPLMVCPEDAAEAMRSVLDDAPTSKLSAI
jgi:GNAT superfamily N-acetyltransferase